MNKDKAIAILKNGVNAKSYDEKIEACQIAIEAIQTMSKEPVCRGDLEDWFINSVSSTDTPIWTTEHLDELFNDFILLPRESK